MEIKDIVSITISLISACVAVGSVIIARITLEQQRNMQGWIINHDLLARAAGMLIEDPNILRILGIDPDDVMKDGITPEELVYINTNLDASSAKYRVSAEKYVELTEYRKNFLRNIKVRTAWKKYLRNRTFSPSPWTKAVDTYIAEFESGSEKSS